MTFIKLDDTCPDHPSLVGLSDAAFACWVRGLCYSSRHLTDGRLPTAALRSLGTTKAAAELVTAGRWIVVEGGWVIHGYTEKQRTREQVERERDQGRARQQRHRGVTAPSRPVSRPVSRRDNAGVTEPEVEVEGEIEKEPPCSPPAGGTTELTLVEHVDRHPDRFDGFWHAYPRKASKPQARRAWAKATKRATPDTIIDGARRYAADPNREDGYTKLPATWLNADAWNDPPLPARTNGTKSGLAASIDRLRTASGPRALGPGGTP